MVCKRTDRNVASETLPMVQLLAMPLQGSLQAGSSFILCPEANASTSKPSRPVTCLGRMVEHLCGLRS